MKSHNIMKRKALISLNLLLAFALFSFTACGALQTCSYCGQSKECEKYDILGVERYICSDCISNPDTLSNNVITEYKAEDVSSYYLDPKDNVSDNSLNDIPSDQNVSSAEDNPASTSSNQSSGILPNDDLANTPSATRSQNEIINSLSALLASNGLSISEPDNNGIYFIKTSNDSDADIKLSFSSDSSGRPTLSIDKGVAASSSNFTNACIDATLSFLNSTDVNGTGYDVYNNAVMHGNYTLDGCRFYYMEDDSQNNGSTATFDISFQ